MEVDKEKLAQACAAIARYKQANDQSFALALPYWSAVGPLPVPPAVEKQLEELGRQLLENYTAALDLSVEALPEVARRYRMQSDPNEQRMLRYEASDIVEKLCNPEAF